MHRPDRTSPFAPVVDPAVWHLRPDFVALSLVVRGGRNAPSDARSAAALQAASEDRTTAAGWAEPHLEAWRDAYRAFGAKPQRTPCSAEALRRRARTPPTVNHLVDAYNALSLRFAVPIGGEDLTAYQGPPRLTVAVGNEPFETVKDGMAVVEQVDPGEVVWRDDRGVTCRRWNWRQTPLTRLGAHSTEMWFVVERLEPMPLAAVEEVGAALADAVRALAPGAEVERRLIRPPAGGLGIRQETAMYQPAHFREDRLEVQHALIHAHPLGILVTRGAAGLDANPVPFLLDPAASPLGTLRAHVARANPQWRALDPEQEALVVFQAVDAYVTPSWYAAKREHGKVVPTWNYAIVQAWGRPRLIDDREWLARQIRALTEQQERHRAEPWAVADAPGPFVAAQLKGIVGVEIPIARIEGKWKASQNRPPADRAGVAEGLERQGDDVSRAMARLVRERGQPMPSTGSSAASPSR